LSEDVNKPDSLGSVPQQLKVDPNNLTFEYEYAVDRLESVGEIVHGTG